MYVYWQNEHHAISGLWEAALPSLLTDSSPKSNLPGVIPKQCLDYVSFLGYKMVPSQAGRIAVVYPAGKDGKRDFLRITGKMMPVTVTTACCQ